MQLIKHSVGESEVLKLKLGRTDLDEWSDKDFISALIKGAFDCCIAKAKSHKSNLMLRLNRLNIPYAISGVTQRYTEHYPTFEYRTYDNDDWATELYDGSQTELLRELVETIFSKEPLNFYQLSYYQPLVKHKQEVNCLYEYLKGFDNILKDGEQKRLLFLKDELGYFGLTAMTFSDNYQKGESDITGILPNKRGQRLYKDIVRFIRNYFKDHIVQGYCGARIQNIPAQRTYLSEGIKVTHYAFTIHFFPFLSKGKETAQQIDLQMAENEQTAMEASIFYQLQSTFTPKYIKQKHRFKKYQFIPVSSKGLHTEEALKASCYFPLNTEEKALAVAQIINENEELVALVYIEYEGVK